MSSVKNHAVKITTLGSSSLDSRPFWPHVDLVKTLTGSALSAGMLPISVEERHIIRVLLMTGSGYMVENENFENWST